MKYFVTIALILRCLATQSQDLAAVVAKKFDDYEKTHQALKTFVVFSQEKFVPGDTAFFTAWFLTEAGQFVGGNQILNLDMIDSEGKVVQHILFRVRDGVGSNQVIINESSRPGTYIMSAYNDCMTDSDPRYAFTKSVTVVDKNVISVANRETKGETKADKDAGKLRIDASSAEIISVTINLPRHRNKELVLAVTANAQLYFTAAFALTKKDSVTIRLPRKGLSEGWNLFSVLSRDSVIVTRSFRLSASIRCVVEVLRDTVQARQQVFSKIRITDASGKPIQTQFAVSVVNENLFDDDISSHDVMSEPPVVPWRNILWTANPPAPRPPKLITMNGEAYFEDTNKPVPRSTILYCFMKKNRFAFEAEVAEKGRVEMVFLDLTGSDEMFFYAIHEGEELQKVKIRWLYNDMKHTPALAFEDTGRPDAYATFIGKKRVVDRSFDYFADQGRGNMQPSVVPLEMEFENMGTVINLQEYKIFPTMEETIRELIPRLSYRKVGEKDIVKVNLSEVDLKTLGGPLYVINGSITKDPDYFLSLDPGDVISIRVVHASVELKRFMPVSRNGIVVVKTKSGKTQRSIVENVLPINGLSAPIEFARMKGEKPEFRSTLSWQPVVKTDVDGRATVSFMTTDDTGKMKIRITGIYAGELFNAEKELYVTFSGVH